MRNPSTIIVSLALVAAFVGMPTYMNMRAKRIAREEQAERDVKYAAYFKQCDQRQIEINAYCLGQSLAGWTFDDWTPAGWKVHSKEEPEFNKTIRDFQNRLNTAGLDVMLTTGSEKECIQVAHAIEAKYGVEAAEMYASGAMLSQHVKLRQFSCARPYPPHPNAALAYLSDSCVKRLGIAPKEYTNKEQACQVVLNKVINSPVELPAVRAHA